MAAGVAGDVDDARVRGAKLHDVALADGAVDTGNFVLLSFRADHHAARFLLEFEIAARMIEVVMGVEDVGQLPAPGRQGHEPASQR